MRHTHTCKHCQLEWTCMREDCCVGRDGRTYAARCDECWDSVDTAVGIIVIGSLLFWCGMMVLEITS